MLVDQKVYIDGEKKIHVVNKFDHSVAAEVARMTEREGGGRAVGKDGFEVRVTFRPKCGIMTRGLLLQKELWLPEITASIRSTCRSFSRCIASMLR